MPRGRRPDSRPSPAETDRAASRVLPILVFVLGTAVSIGAWRTMHITERNRSRTQFQADARQRVDAIRFQLNKAL